MEGGRKKGREGEMERENLLMGFQCSVLSCGNMPDGRSHGLILEQVWTKSNLGSFQFFTGYGVYLENGIQYLFSFDFTG